MNEDEIAFHIDCIMFCHMYNPSVTCEEAKKLAIEEVKEMIEARKLNEI